MWRDVTGYEGLYRVSEDGRVYSARFRREIKPFFNERGYKKIHLGKSGVYKNIYVHRLVAAAFIPNPSNYPTVNHIDGIKINNHYTNLEWCTYQHNSRHAIRLGLWNRTYLEEYVGEKHPMHKLRESDVAAIKRARIENPSITEKELAARYGVGKTTVGDVLRGKCWRWVQP